MDAWVWIVIVVIIIFILLFFIGLFAKPKTGLIFNSNLLGSNEVPPVSTSAAGNAHFVLHPNRKSLKYDIRFNNLSTPFSSAHFHLGQINQNGPIIKTLTHDFIPTNNLRTSGFIQGTWSSKDNEPLTELIVDEILANRVYVNIHSTQYPNGELRGQVSIF